MFLNNDQTNQLREEPIGFINEVVFPSIITPIAERDDMDEFNSNLIDQGVLLLPDNDEAIERILEITEEYSEVVRKVCRHKNPS